LAGEPVTVPNGAAYLFVALTDIFYSDNTDPNGDFGVAITVNSSSSVNGKVLIAGGFDNLGNALNTAELYDPALGFTSPTGNLSDPNGRGSHVSIVLPNGNVLLIGGVSNVSNLATAELYDPATGTFTPTGSMSQGRGLPAAVLLADGRVLVSGGFGGNTQIARNTAEIYDPATGVFTPTGNMTQGRGRHQLTLLPNGKVLVTGGRDAQQNFFALASAEIFDPFANQGAGAFSAIGNMNSPRFKHTATLLSNGTVLIAGGFNGDNTSSSVASAEIFDPSTNTFIPTGSMNTPRARHTSTLLPDGTVLEAGGINSFSGVIPAAPAELYSPASGTFSLTGPLITGRELPSATLLLPNGNVLLSGGDDGVNVLASTEVYYNPVAQAPVVITTTSVPNGFISQPYVQLLLSQNRSGPITWSVVSGVLPPGLSLFGTVPPGISPGAGASGLLFGTPTATGSFTFTLQATDGVSTATGTFTINVSLAPLVFTSNTMPTASAGRGYSQPLPVMGGTLPYTVTQTGGTLPPGLALSSNGLLSGTPATAGVFTFTVSVTDASATPQTATQTLTIAINTLFITTTALPNGIVGVPYNTPISTSGGTLPLSFSQANTAFPPGLAIQQPAANSHNGALAGTPTLAGHYTFSESVSDSSNPAQTATQYYVMDVSPAGTSAPATVSFVSQPLNSIGGQLLIGRPIIVNVTDATSAPVSGALVAMNFNAAPPCSSATLGGTLTAITNGNGNAVFRDLTIDRGQLGYTLLASAGSASAVSQPFTVNGFCDTGNLSTARSLNTNTLLPNGKVLIAGGFGGALGGVLNTAELYDPSTGLFSPTGNMTATRGFHSATLLPNGQVLIAGGQNSAGQLQTSELYDPASGVFTATGNLNVARAAHTATLILSGKVLVAGAGSASAELYDPALGVFTFTGNMNAARSQNTATLLANGTVLIAGGTGSVNPLATAEVYDPILGSFSATGSMSLPRSVHAAALLPDGRVLVVGGATSISPFHATASAEIYDPTLGTFSPTSSLSGPLPFLTATVLTDGKVLVSEAVTAEVYDPVAGVFTTTGSPSVFHAQILTPMLPNGTVLVAGGDPLNPTVEIYYSTAPLAPLAITTTSLATGLQGTPYTQLLLEQGGVGNLTWSETGALPTGLNLSAQGVLSGTPTASGTFPLTVSLTDSSVPAKTATASYSLVVNSNFQMSLTLDGPLLAINRSFNATITLAAPVPTGSSVTVALADNPTGVITISPATQTILVGQTTAVFTLTAGATGGSTVLTASASGYPNATAPLTVTSNLISFGTIPVLAPTQSASLPVSLSFAAPPGGLTINFTSADTSVATITPSVFVPAGLFIPSANPQVTGVTIGSTQVTATATGFAPDTAAVTVTVTASLRPTFIQVSATRTVTETLTISAPAPAGGITFNLASDNVGAATVPATVTVPAGQLSVGFGVTGVAQGSANLSVTSAGITTITAAINVGAMPGIFLSSPIIGNNLIARGGISLGDVPPSGTANPSLTLTSSDPTHFLLSADPAKVGTASITLPLTSGSTSVPAFYIEGQNFSGTTAITATLTATSSGYTNGTATLTLYPTGLTYYFGGGTLSTTTFSAPTGLTVYLVTLAPGTLSFYTLSGNPLGPQAPGPIPVAVTSTNTSVGTVTGSPASIGVGAYYTQAISFVPATVGTTNLNLTTPTGYFTPANIPVQTVATVTAPAISFNVNGFTGIVGNNLLSNGGIGIAAPPPSAETMTITSSDPTHFLLSTSPTAVGTASITLPLTAGSFSVPPFYIEGQNFSGTAAITATLTASAPGYANGNATVNLYPTGLTYYFGGTLSTTTFSAPSVLTVYLVTLNPGTLTFYTLTGNPVGPQAGPIPVAVSSTNTSVGTITGSPATISVGSYFSQAISFVPAAAGTTNLNLATPAGYFTPANIPVQTVATVTAPPLNVSSSVIGNNLVQSGGLSLVAAPPSNETLTLTSSDPTHFLLSTSPTAVGTASITLQLTGGSFNVPQFYIEGQNFSGTTAITATLTASASGFANGTATLTLYPTGLTYYFGNNTLSTTTFSGPTGLAVYLVTLNPGTLTFYTLTGNPVGPQAGPIPVAVSSTNTSVGTITGSPATISAGSYFSQAISFVPATAGTTNLNLATPAGYFTPANVPVQIVATVTAPAINLASSVIGNNLVQNGGLGLGAIPPSNETLTLTSSDPVHFLLSTSPTAVGTASITLQLTGGSSNVPQFYIEGQNFSGIAAITATLKASAAGFSDGIATMSLYPTGLTYYFGNNTLNTTTTSGPTALTVYLVTLTPGTLTFYTLSGNLGPQAPSPTPVAVTSTNTSVGTVSGSPASIGVGIYYTQAISFVPVATGTTNLDLVTPAGYFTPSNISVQIVATVQ